MTDITIPAAALEAGARAIADVEYPRLPPRNEHYEMARAAFLAMLTAWPGMREGQAWNAHTGDLRWSNSIILPLPQEASDE